MHGPWENIPRNHLSMVPYHDRDLLELRVHKVHLWHERFHLHNSRKNTPNQSDGELGNSYGVKDTHLFQLDDSESVAGGHFALHMHRKQVKHEARQMSLSRASLHYEALIGRGTITAA